MHVEEDQRVLVRPAGKLRVCEYRDGSLHLFVGPQEPRRREPAERPAPVPAAKAVARPRRRWKSASDHPRRRGLAVGVYRRGGD